MGRGDAQHGVLIPTHHRHLLSRQHVPQSYGPVVASRNNALAVGAEADTVEGEPRSAHHRRFRRARRVDVPQLEAVVFLSGC